MAKAFPKSQFSGFDYHEPSLVRARELACESGVSDRITFQRASAKEFPGTYDLVAFFDSLHDMGDPVGVATHVKSTLKTDGTWMIVEPFAGI
jgi:tRNA A58 N-methylase Trm61